MSQNTKAKTKIILVHIVLISAIAAVILFLAAKCFGKPTAESVMRDWYGENLYVSDSGELYWSLSPKDINPDTGMPWTLLPLTDLFPLEPEPEVTLQIINGTVSATDAEIALVWRTEKQGIDIAGHFYVEIYLDGRWYCLNADMGTVEDSRPLPPSTDSSDTFKLSYDYPAGRYRLIGEYQTDGDRRSSKYICAEFTVE